MQQRAAAIYDELIIADHSNLEFFARRFDTENYCADALSEDNKLKKASEIYRTAFEKLKSDAPQGDAASPYLSFVQGLMLEKISHICLLQNNLNAAAFNYRKTLEFWADSIARKTILSRSPEKLIVCANNFLRQFKN